MAWVTKEFSLTTTGNDAYVVGEGVIFEGAGASNIQLIQAKLGSDKCDNFKVEYSIDGVNFDGSTETAVLSLDADDIKIIALSQAYPYYRVNGHSSDGDDVTWDFIFAELVV